MIVDKILSYRTQLEQDYLLAETGIPENLKERLADEFLKRENLSFVFGDDPENYYGKQIFKLQKIEIEYLPKYTKYVVDVS